MDMDMAMDAAIPKPMQPVLTTGVADGRLPALTMNFLKPRRQQLLPAAGW